MKSGQIKRYKDMIKKAVSFLKWQTTFVGTFLVKPLFSGCKAIVQDLCDVFNVKTDPCYDLVQIFAGEAVVSEELSRAGLKVCEPIEQIYKYNLRSAQDRREILQLCRTRRPKLLTLEYPCTLWTQLTRVNYRGEAKQQQLRRQRLRDELNSKRDNLFENPETLEVSRQSQIKRLKEHPRVKEVKVDMCQFNLRHQQSNGMVKKPTTLLVSSDSYVGRLSSTESTRPATSDLMGGESDDWFYYENVGDFTEMPVKLPDGPDWSRVAAWTEMTGSIQPKLDRTGKLKIQPWNKPEPVAEDIGARAI
ncbi:unnamed protein product, partial [Prorocentrum cordatum]